MQTPDITRLIELQKLLAAFSGVRRTVQLPGSEGRHENDVEHSFTLAIAGWYLAPHFPHLDANKIIRYALAHDLVEVHAGDVFAYADATKKEAKKENEAAAARQLAKDWPDFPEMHDVIKAYEEKTDDESKFVYALDKLMPAILNYLTDGYVWKHHHVTFEAFKHEKETKMIVSPEAYGYYEQLRDLLTKRPDLFPKD